MDQVPDQPLPTFAVTSSPSGSDAALLVDWENLKLCLAGIGRPAPNLSSLVATAREFGRVIVTRAYADWTQSRLALDAPNLYRVGIDPVYVPGSMERDGRTVSIKNSADLRLTVDAVDLCDRLPHARTFVLVTGDQDFIHAVNFLRMRGRRVVVIGVATGMSRLLAAAADEVLLYERDIEPTVLTAPLSAVSEPETTSAIAMVTNLLRERCRGDGYPLSQLGNDLTERFKKSPRELFNNVPLKQIILLAEFAGEV